MSHAERQHRTKFQNQVLMMPLLKTGCGWK